MLGVEKEYKAYSLFEVKSLDANQRTFKGWATTPAVDRVGDTVDPLGATFADTLPLLHQHNHSLPIGLVKFGKPTRKGIEFQAEIPAIQEEGPLKDRVDTAWGELKYGLVRAVSIGFRPIEYEYNEAGGLDFKKVEIYELSIVSVPALPAAVITQVKAMDEGARMIERAKPTAVRLVKATPERRGAIKLLKPSA